MSTSILIHEILKNDLCIPIFSAETAFAFSLFIENYHDISMTPLHYTERHLTQVPGRIINEEDKLQIARREKIWQVPFCIKRI